MDTATHKILVWLEHLWPYISGMVITLLAAAKLWWYDKQQMKQRIANIEIIAQNAVTKSELQACREDVRKEDRLILKEIQESNKLNQEQHEHIVDLIIGKLK